MKSIRKRNQKKGAFSIIIITLVLIVLFAFSGYSDILSQTFILNEMQQKMDRAALNALNKSVDISLLREEVLGLDEGTYIGNAKQQALKKYEDEIERAFRYELTNSMQTNETMKRIKILKVEAEVDLSDWRTGVDGEKTPQIYLDAYVQIDLAIHSQFDVFSSEDAIHSMTNAKGNDFKVAVQGKSEDGLRELFIHNSTRLVYQ